MSPPFRADHVGSLLRPPKLKDARNAVKAGKLPASELRAMEQAEIRRVVKQQEETGIKAVTDGDFPRDTWYLDFIFEVGGVERITAPYTLAFKDASGKVEGVVPHWKVGGRIHHKKTIFGEDFAFLKSVAKATAKQCLPSPTMMHFRGTAMGIDPKIYADIDAYRQDVAKVYAEQLSGLGKLGCTYVQLDDTVWGFANDPAWRERFWGGEKR
jgi:5-methyltetrahydropteroyltriglutamate--homocysteine methyltransferase